ncbi:MAG: hypothetical protein JSR63_11380 [Proteobacteria bacterium]|nr:hypothetical protein [Pseudomonadota bacterium]MBS0218760.1 hypothetical protein [Pseudomonadota bacterium]
MTRASSLAMVAVLAFAGTAQAKDEAPASTPVADVLFLGSYHMANHNRDVFNTKSDDVTQPKRQQEIAEIARLVERYKPTKIMVEINTEKQDRIDQEFRESCAGKRPLSRDEVEQLGYRIACDMKLPGVIAVDWNDLGPIKDEDSVDYLKAVERNGQQQIRAEDMRIGSANAAADQAVLDHGTIGDMLRRLNSREWLTNNARAYFHIGMYGSQADPVGANWIMLWQGRNLYIFNNIVRHTSPGDRVLVIYGAGHGNELRRYANDSGMYRVQDTEQWLGRNAPHSTAIGTTH